MLSFNDFKKITIDDKKIFDKIYGKYPVFHSDYLFTTLLSWMDYGNYKYAFYKNNIIISSRIDDTLRLRPPIGDFDKDLFIEIFNLAKSLDANYPIGMINNDAKKWLCKNFSNLDFFAHRDFFEYIYLSSDLADLKGSKYSKIRNRLNKFERNNEYLVEQISEENNKEIKKFLKRWCLWKDCESDHVLKHEKKAINFSINNFFDLGLDGLIIRINDKIEAISIFEQINQNTAVIHYEKGSPYYDGIYKAINKQAAIYLKDNFKFINRESDMGISGLRKAKESYRPHHMIEVYHISKDHIP